MTSVGQLKDIVNYLDAYDKICAVVQRHRKAEDTRSYVDIIEDAFTTLRQIRANINNVVRG